MGLLEEFPELKHLKHRISVHAYHRMGETGILAPEARVELIEGEIIDRRRSEAGTPPWSTG